MSATLANLGTIATIISVTVAATIGISQMLKDRRKGKIDEIDAVLDLYTRLTTLTESHLVIQGQVADLRAALALAISHVRPLVDWIDNGAPPPPPLISADLRALINKH